MARHETYLSRGWWALKSCLGECLMGVIAIPIKFESLPALMTFMCWL